MLSLFINNNQSNQKIINPTGNQVTVNLNPPIILDDNKDYQIRLLNSSITYCMPNVTSKNNTLSYMFNYNGTQTQRTLTFDDGLYSINDINFTISRFTEIGMNGNDASLIQFYADESTSKIIVYFPVICHKKLY